MIQTGDPLGSSCRVFLTITAKQCYFSRELNFRKIHRLSKIAKLYTRENAEFTNQKIFME